MTNKIHQDRLNKALWSACDTFHASMPKSGSRPPLWATCDPFSGTISTDSYQDFILAMRFLKYISDVWQGHYEGYQSEYGDEPGNGERIDQALYAIEEANAVRKEEGTSSSPCQGGGREGVPNNTVKLSHRMHAFTGAANSPRWQGL